MPALIDRDFCLRHDNWAFMSGVSFVSSGGVAASSASRCAKAEERFHVSPLLVHVRRPQTVGTSLRNRSPPSKCFRLSSMRGEGDRQRVLATMPAVAAYDCARRRVFRPAPTWFCCWILQVRLTLKKRLVQQRRGHGLCGALKVLHTEAVLKETVVTNYDVRGPRHEVVPCVDR